MIDWMCNLRHSDSGGNIGQAADAVVGPGVALVSWMDIIVMSACDLPHVYLDVHPSYYGR